MSREQNVELQERWGAEVASNGDVDVLDEMVATDDHVAIRYTVRGTHESEFMGIAPTGKRIEAAAMQIARFEDGRVIERWGVTDQLGILQQLGAVVST